MLCISSHSELLIFFTFYIIKLIKVLLEYILCRPDVATTLRLIKFEIFLFRLNIKFVWVFGRGKKAKF